ncbi:hypothetical protein NUH88_16105 [Nisaea acidiphila]|uniref:Uncharacterized protein n=1 Tax=Nisaea acidiphila TaxID=1862145 RepID=A0A9J7APS5_9PROT|nr:hypothetical protein [Nisaea acidiphila]UUX48914.1 hypothetical protein NUH88_16105 [Nisaea acidiphila]
MNAAPMNAALRNIVAEHDNKTLRLRRAHEDLIDTAARVACTQGRRFEANKASPVKLRERISNESDEVLG